MRIQSLSVENFRAARRIELSDLRDAIVIAGPNGCGKSSIFDTLRLLKSAYGGYHVSEWQWFWNEFQINIQNLSREAQRVLYYPDRNLKVRAIIELSEAEKEYLWQNGPALLSQSSWNRVLRRHPDIEGEVLVISPADRRIYKDQVRNVTSGMVEALNRDLEHKTLTAQLVMTPSGDVEVLESQALEVIFSSFDPQKLGVIDYHPPNRSYNREQVGSVNLNIATSDNRHRQHALYNTQGKYTNVKQEMASAYVQGLLAREAGIENGGGNDIIDTLKELFEIFFPGKKFLGPQPTTDGKLLFPVEIEDGRQHDIDDLSSGEKEVILGYLRLRNSAPRNSVILLDEPELHLNPRLIRGLPRFYQKYLGEALGNQLWMITHSDALLREAVEEPAFDVYHMQSPSSSGEGENQLHPVSASVEIERAIMDLVGDLATYSPRSKVVILEGGGDSEFDLKLVLNLFPDFGERVNLISGGNKQRVGALHFLLEKATKSGKLDARFFSIVDRDSEDAIQRVSEHQYTWDVYHIENYLLHPAYIRSVLESLELGGGTPSEAEIEHQLLECARETVDDLVRIKLERRVNQVLVRCIQTGINPSSTAIAEEFLNAAERSLKRIQQALTKEINLNMLKIEEEKARQELLLALGEGRWRSDFRGRNILAR